MTSSFLTSVSSWNLGVWVWGWLSRSARFPQVATGGEVRGHVVTPLSLSSTPSVLLKVQTHHVSVGNRSTWDNLASEGRRDITSPSSGKSKDPQEVTTGNSSADSGGQ